MNLIMKLAPLYVKRFELLAKLKGLTGRQIAGLVTLLAFAVTGVLAGQIGPEAALELALNAVLSLVQ